jgi:hypothetical protein
MAADGGHCVAELAVLAGQPALFGSLSVLAKSGGSVSVAFQAIQSPTNERTSTTHLG